MRLLSLLAMTCVAVTGCQSSQLVGSSRSTITVAGPAASPNQPGLYGLFQLTYNQALEAQQAVYEKGAVAGSQEKFRNMAEVGFGLVQANCAEFFSNRGENQKWIQLGSDLVALGGALATGVLAITGTSALAVSIVALSSATAYQSIDVYTKNFLFGVENIDAVRVLTINALGADATESLRTPIGSWSFAYSLNAIMANQELCKPASILALTRQAIRTSKVNAAESTGVGEMDNLRKERIGLEAGGTGVRPTEREIAALCWAADYKVNHLAGDNAAIGVATMNFPKGPNTSGDWDAVKGRVREQCRALSPSAQAYMDKQIVELRASGGTAASPGETPVIPPAKQTTNQITPNPQTAPPAPTKP